MRSVADEITSIPLHNQIPWCIFSVTSSTTSLSLLSSLNTVYPTEAEFILDRKNN